MIANETSAAPTVDLVTFATFSPSPCTQITSALAVVAPHTPSYLRVIEALFTDENITVFMLANR